MYGFFSALSGIDVATARKELGFLSIEFVTDILEGVF